MTGWGLYIDTYVKIENTHNYMAFMAPRISSKRSKLIIAIFQTVSDGCGLEAYVPLPLPRFEAIQGDPTVASSLAPSEGWGDHPRV
jgi:hypothetical protein